MPIRVVIAEDDLIVREGVRRILEAGDEVEVVAVCDDAAGLIRCIEEHAPDVVVTDIRMPPERTDEGLRVARRLRHEHPQVGVVVLSMYAEPAYALMLLEDGTRGRAYLLKQRVSSRRHLVDAIREVADGGSVIDPRIVEVLVNERARARTSPLAALTSREREILAGVAEGRSNGAIAATLVLSKRAVEKHVNAIFAKLGLRPEDGEVDRRVRAALLFLSEGSPQNSGGRAQGPPDDVGAFRP